MPPSSKTSSTRLFAVLGPLVVFFLVVNLERSAAPPCPTVHTPELSATGVQVAPELPPPPVNHPVSGESIVREATVRPVVQENHVADVSTPVEGGGERQFEGHDVTRQDVGNEVNDGGHEVSAPNVAEHDTSGSNVGVGHAFGSMKRRGGLPSCARNGEMAKSFLFVFMGHSGSSAILSELQGHSQTYIEDREPVDHYEYEFNTTLALQYTRDIFRRGMEQGKAAGFKMRPIHIMKQPEEWAKLVKEFDTRIIWQYRENLVKQAVGEYSYKYLNDSSVIEGLRSQEDIRKRCSTGVGCSFEIKDFGFFHRTLKDCLHSDEAIAEGVHALASGSDCVHQMPYEDYLYDRKGAMSRLFKFLGLREEDTQPERYKATNDNLCSVVSNWKELCANFYGCHVWRHMFEDDRHECYCDFASGHIKYCDTVYMGSPTKAAAR